MRFISKKEIFLEESIEGFSQDGLEVLELPLSRQAFQLILALAFLLALIAITKMLFLGGWLGSFYQARAEANAGKDYYLASARGIIYDRFGEPLVEDVPTFSVSVKINKLLANSGLILEALNLPKEILIEQFKNVNAEKTSSVIIARDVQPEEINRLKSLNLDGVEIINDFKRHYLEGPAFAHVLGYLGQDSANKIVGKTGLENFYDSFLRGQDGERIVYRDALGNALDEKINSLPADGYRLNTTLDAGLQTYFYDRLAAALNSLGSRGAVGIALNPQNGEVLAMVNLPSFNNNIFVESGHNAEKFRVLNSSGHPLFNRSVSGAYNPGSTIKPLVALAALSEGVIDVKKQIFSAGFIEIPNPYFPDKPSRFLDWKPHGWVDLYSALARSSNVYFYEIGGGFNDTKGLGIEKLKEWWLKFGLGQKTNIDLPSEDNGFLPDPELKEQKSRDIWRIGDTYNVSIGQGDLLVTPIQLINFIATIANGGKLYQPYVVKNIIGPDNEIAKENNLSILSDYSSLGGYIAEVQEGMNDAVDKPYGTAHLLSDLPVAVSAKTGSAQILNNTQTNAFFVGYLPAEALAKAGAPLDKQIAILVLIENAREGSLNAVPVAKDVLNWYYWNRLATNP
ncbi:MAG: penicillin-binding transpeptidase domain-containing protein [bacterium]|nr:penicillin-binding transpeptidase domain-containing protein [bacterium]